MKKIMFLLIPALLLASALTLAVETRADNKFPPSGSSYMPNR